MKKYSIYTLFRNAFFLIISKAIYGKKIRIIKGFPRIIKTGNIKFQDGFTAGIDLRLEALSEKSEIIFGKNVKINDYCHIGSITSITIGDNCLIGSRVTIVDHEHGVYGHSDSHDTSHPETAPDERPLNTSPIVIEKNTWLAEGVVILSGVTIGEGSVIGANAVVTKNIPKHCIAAGAPAKVIKKFNEDTNSWEKV